MVEAGPHRPYLYSKGYIDESYKSNQIKEEVDVIGTYMKNQMPNIF